MRTVRIAAFLLICIATLAVAQQAPEDLQFNVPYLCNDGHTYVVHKCEKGPKFEACFYQREQDSERYNTRQSVEYQMTKMCKLKGSASPVAASAQPSSDLLVDTPYQCAGDLMLTIFECQRQSGQEACFVKAELNGKFLGQVPKPRSEIVTQIKACTPGKTFDPGYIAEFPSSYRVIQGMLAGNPQQNIERAIGAFYQLSEIIKVLAAQRGSNYTPDEKKLLDDYSRLSRELAQAGAQKFPDQKFDPATNPYRFSRNDPKFGFGGIPVWTTFLSPPIQAQFAQLVGGDDSHYLAAVEQQKRAGMQQLDTEMRVEQSEQNMRKDAGSVAARHCVESGRSEVECLGEGLKVGAMDLMGGNPLKGIVPETPAGLRLTGLYSVAGFGLQFSQDAVAVGCGKLVPQPLPYSMERSANQILVKIPISPRPLTLSYRPDGSLAGPGPIDVAGRVVIGGMTDTASTNYQMQTQTSTTQRQIDAGDVSNYSADQVHQNGMEYSVDQQSTSTSWVPTTAHHYSVPTAPKTERCNVGTLPPTGGSISVSNALTQVLGSKASKSANTAPGLRLNGTYAAKDGLKIQFRDDSATLECGESFNSEGYAVRTEGGQLIVKFQNSTGPLSFVLQPNGTLTGAGSVDVAGRRAIQGAGGDVEYLPRNARCVLGTLEASK